MQFGNEIGEEILPGRESFQMCPAPSLQQPPPHITPLQEEGICDTGVRAAWNDSQKPGLYLFHCSVICSKTGLVFDYHILGEIPAGASESIIETLESWSGLFFPLQLLSNSNFSIMYRSCIYIFQKNHSLKAVCKMCCNRPESHIAFQG